MLNRCETLQAQISQQMTVFHEQQRIGHNIMVEACDQSCLYKTGALITGIVSLIPRGRIIGLCAFGGMSIQAFRMDSRIMKYEDYNHGSLKRHYHDMNLCDLDCCKTYPEYFDSYQRTIDDVETSIKTFETNILPRIIIIRDELPTVYDRAQRINGYRNPNPRLSYCYKMWAWSLPFKDSWYLLTPFKRWLE